MTDMGPPVEPTPRDRALSAVQGLTGALPLIGSIVANLLNQIIPEQRWERIAEYLSRLERRVSAVEARTLRSVLQEPRKVDLFEDGAFQAVRALSSERLEYIAALVARGLTSDDREEIEAKRLLKLLDRIDDDQVVILQSKLSRHMRSEEFYERHGEVLEPVGAHLGSSREDLDREAMYRLARRQLVDLGLLDQTFKKPRRGDLPEFDEKTGMIKSQGTSLNSLGRLLLRRIGLAEEDEF